MAGPSCAVHDDRAAVIIVTFMDPAIEEPTAALCEECAPQMAATILQSFTGLDVVGWINGQNAEEQAAEESIDPTPAPEKAPKSRKRTTNARNGPIPIESSDLPTDDASDNDETPSEAPVASATA